MIARRAGLDAVPVPVDDHGLDVGRLRETGTRAVLLTPANQCPTGVVLGPSRRRELVAWADKVDGVILEDDYDAEFRYDRQPVGSLQGLNSARVIALGSVSKTLAPAIRLGWVLAPARFVAGIVEEKRLRSPARLAWTRRRSRCSWRRAVSTATCEEHVREVYHARRDVLAAEVEHAFGPGRLQGLAAGCHALLRLPDGSSERAVEATAATMGVRVNGLGHYRFIASRSGSRTGVMPARPRARLREPQRSPDQQGHPQTRGSCPTPNREPVPDHQIPTRRNRQQGLRMAPGHELEASHTLALLHVLFDVEAPGHSLMTSGRERDGVGGDA